METRACPNPHCDGAELTQSYSHGHMNFYCPCCGHEEREACEAPRRTCPSLEDRRKELGATVTSIKSKKKQPSHKARVARDKGDWVPKRGAR